jgi:bifunctional DNA-binding transcriptional regulator/antitoxin component of YhaV-PrlF toxin-antitoxin module
MPTTTVSSKGQITLPAALVRKHELIGQTMSVTEQPDGSIVLRRRLSLNELLDAVTPGRIYGDDPDAYLANLRSEW